MMFKKSPPALKPSTSKPATPESSITETAPCRKSLRLRVTMEIITPVRTSVLSEFQRQAALPGFRKGKAPADLVERQYADRIQQETLHRVTKQVFEQTAKEHNFTPVGPFEVSKADFTETDGLMLEATVEVEPAFPLGSYKDIPLVRQPIDVSAPEIETALAKLQESMAQLIPTGQGDAKERKVPPLDDELAKDLGFENVGTLREHVTAKLHEQKRVAQAQAMEAALCDELLRRHTFDVPPRLVARQTERLSRDFKVRLLLSGVPEAQIEENMKEFSDELRTSAARHVKLSFVLDRIASQESIGVTERELVERLWQLATRWKKDPMEVRKIFDAQGLWPSVLSAIRQEKTIAMLMASAAGDGAAVEGKSQKEEVKSTST